jgi:hypothetical protein
MDLYYNFEFFGSVEEKELFFKVLISPTALQDGVVATLDGQLVRSEYNSKPVITARIMDYFPGDGPTPFTSRLASGGNVLGLIPLLLNDETSIMVAQHLFDNDMPEMVGLEVSRGFISQRTLELSHHYRLKLDPTPMTSGTFSKILH